MTTRIVVVDDHPMVQAALRTALATAMPNAELIACRSIESLLRIIAVEPNSIDLVLLDLGMPDTTGFSGLFMLQAQYPITPVAIISAQEDASTIQRAIAFGASGFLPKSLELRVLVKAVASILDGDVWTPEISEPLLSLDGDIDLASRFASLSPRQMKILMFIVDGQLNKQIAGHLNVAEQTIKIHISAIFKKLGVTNRTQAAMLFQKLHSDH